METITPSWDELFNRHFESTVALELLLPVSALVRFLDDYGNVDSLVERTQFPDSVVHRRVESLGLYF